MIVAGVMSGTSADGINVALARLRGRGFATEFKLLAHYEFPYSPAVRRAILELMNAEEASVARLSRLNFLLGELYADAVFRARQRARVTLELVGCHGQTIYHQGEREPFLGSKVAATWQTGEAALIAARVRAPVVSDFRPADIAAGGKGAPLVPFLDYVLYRDSRAGRIAQNLGGIGNLTAIPAGASANDVLAFDTGPGNMVIDAVCERLFHRSYDRNGTIAQRGNVLPEILKLALEHPFFRRKPPKTAGREEFGRDFVADFIKACGRARHEDIIATVTQLTARSIGIAVRKFVLGIPSAERSYTHPSPKTGERVGHPTLAKVGHPTKTDERVGHPTSAKVGHPTLAARSYTHPSPKTGERVGHPTHGWGNHGTSYTDYIVSGGGTRNLTLMRMIRDELKPLGLRVRLSDEFGVPSEAKEALAFAVLAYESWHQRPSNIPSATGARRPAILGKISYA
jgi:anhydro-N-acetylmuramic acid kinase